MNDVNTQRLVNSQMRLQITAWLQGGINLFFFILLLETTTTSSLAFLSPIGSLLSCSGALYLSCAFPQPRIRIYTCFILWNDIVLLWSSVAWIFTLTKVIHLEGPFGFYLASSISTLLVSVAGRRVRRNSSSTKTSLLPVVKSGVKETARVTINKQQKMIKLKPTK